MGMSLEGGRPFEPAGSRKKNGTTQRSNVIGMERVGFGGWVLVEVWGFWAEFHDLFLENALKKQLLIISPSQRCGNSCFLFDVFSRPIS